MNPIEAFDAACDLARAQVELAVKNPTAATPCSEFNVAQLVGHVVAALDGNAAILGGTNDGLDPFDPPSYPADEFLTRFDTARGRLKAAIGDRGLDAMVEHPAAPEPMPVAAAIGFPTFDMYVHAWDLAQANGVASDVPTELHGQVAAFCRQAFTGEAVPGVVEASVEASAGASPMEDLAAFLGRRPLAAQG